MGLTDVEVDMGEATAAVLAGVLIAVAIGVLAAYIVHRDNKKIARKREDEQARARVAGYAKPTEERTRRIEIVEDANLPRRERFIPAQREDQD